MIAYQFGDETAFKELYSRYSGRLYAFLRSKLHDEGTVKDVFQTTFLKLHRSRDRYQAKLPFAPWIFTICRNEMRDALRREHRSQENPFPDVPAVAAESTDSSVDLGSLTAEQRRALEMRFQEGSAFEEIAAALETSPANARQIVSRAVRALKKLYGQKE